MAERQSVLILGNNDGVLFIDIYNKYIKAFDKNKYAVTLAFLTGAPSTITTARSEADETIFFNIPKTDIRGLKIKAITKIIQYCKAKQFKIVIGHRYKPIYILAWVAQFCTLPTIIFVMHAMGTLSALHRKILMFLLMKKNILFAGVSQAIKEDLENNLWGLAAKRVMLLPNSIDIKQIEQGLLNKETARQILSLRPDAFIFGHVGRLVPDKDQITLIKAFAHIKAHCPRAMLIIIGEGKLNHILAALTKELRLQNDVILAGAIHDAYRYFKAFDCFVLTSVQEGFGIVLLEAMIAKLPIIATQVGGIPEVMANVGLLIEAQNISACAEAMQRIYLSSFTEKNKMGECAYRRVCEHFSSTVFKDKFWEQFHAYRLHHYF